MTQLEFNRALQSIERELKNQAADEVRKRWREEKGLIYVQSYTVHAHLRRRKPRKGKLRLVHSKRYSTERIAATGTM